MSTGNKVKKSLIITTVGGFVSRFEMDNVHIMQKLGYEVHYAANFNNTVYEFDKNELINNGIVLHHVDIDKNPYNIVSLYKNYKEILEIAKTEKINLIHCHTPVGGVLGRLVGRKIDCKVIYTAHGFHFYKGAPMKNWMFYYPVEKILARYTDCLITINEADYKQSQKMKAKHTVRIPGIGIDLDRFKPGRKYERTGDIFRVVSVGELNQNKNHQVVIKAINLLNDKNIQYDIYGKGDGKERLEKMIAEYHMNDQVHLRGYVNDTRSVLYNADCFVFPSIREGLGMAALEAMACGVPLIAADNRGTREYARHGENAYVCEPNDEESFAYYIKKIKENPETAEELLANALKTVQWFSKEHTDKIMEQVYTVVGL